MEVLDETDDLKQSILRFFRKEAKAIAKKVLSAYAEKAKSPAERVLDKVRLDHWSTLAEEITERTERIFRDSGVHALGALSLDDSEEMVNLLDEDALAFAEKRAAELVGKRVLDDGRIVDNPNADWAITESTRDYLRSTVAEAVEEGWSSQTLANAIVDNFAFSDERAETIARTELAFAHVEGNMDAYKIGGVTHKRWILGSEHDIDDVCNDNADAGVIPFDEPFPSGDMAPPGHPNCVCDVIPEYGEDESNE